LRKFLFRQKIDNVKIAQCKFGRSVRVSVIVRIDFRIRLGVSIREAVEVWHGEKIL